MKVLIIRFSSIGDIVLTTPVVRCLKQQLLGIEIHYLTKPAFAPILQANPYIDKVITLKKNLRETARMLKDEGYDQIIDLHNNQRTWLLKNMLRAPARSFNKINMAKWLMVNFKVNKLPHVHIVDRYLETVLQLGINNDGQGLDYFIPEEERVSSLELPETHGNNYIAIAIGAQHNTKKLPQHKLIQLCLAINTPIILLGGSSDRNTGQAIAEASGVKIYNACGVYSLHGSASLVQQAKLVISHDTGLMHIAAALQKPILSIWGNTIPEFGMYPYYGKNKVSGSQMFEVEPLSCRPCSKIGHQTCPKGHFKCMEEQDIKAVAKRVNELLE